MPVDVQIIGGGILTASDLDRMNIEEMKRWTPESHESKFFSIGNRHRIHVQLSHYPFSTPTDGMFIYLEKEVGRWPDKRWEYTNFTLLPNRDPQELRPIFEEFGQVQAEAYAKKLSQRLMF